MKFTSSIFSYKAMVILLVLYALSLASATFVETIKGTPFVKEWFYTSWWFIILNILLVANFVGVSIKRGLMKQRKWGALMLHYSFAIILIGALYTHLFSQEGVMHIREGETSDTLLSNTGEPIGKLPFSVKLNEFVLERYPGSNSPSSFSSDVVITDDKESRQTKIFMNNIAYVKDYRLYQSSYDKDELGTVLSVAKDMEGTIISYIGYILLTIGLVLSILHKNSRFRTLARNLKSASMLFVVCLLPYFVTAQQMPSEISPTDAIKNVLSRSSADSLSTVLVQNPEGRIEPMSTYASKILRKIYRDDDFYGMLPEQVVMGWVADPNVWSRVPMIYVSNPLLLKKYGLKSNDYISFNSLFDDQGQYILSKDVEEAYAKAAKDQSKMDKDIAKLDEKMNILYSIFNGDMLKLFPLNDSPNGVWLSHNDNMEEDVDPRDSLFISKVLPWMFAEADKAHESGNWSNVDKITNMIKVFQKAKADPQHYIEEEKVKKEVFYNRADIFKKSGLGYLISSFLLLVALFMSLVKGNSKTLSTTIKVLYAAILLLFAYQAFGIGLRWYISGRAPWTNSYESMIYVGWCAVLAGIIFIRRSPITIAIATLLGGAIIMISHLSWLDPEITPLVPVLKSYWLLFHVAIITASYGFFGMSALLGIVSLSIMAFVKDKRVLDKVNEMTIINEMSQIIGLILLTIGVFIGAVWANESWGRYWAWDPKETWALITMVVYTFSTHMRFVKTLSDKYVFNVVSVFALYSVLMTFFGVNYFLSGMHSYGSSDGFAVTPVVLATIAVVALSIIAGVKHKKLNK